MSSTGSTPGVDSESGERLSVDSGPPYWMDRCRKGDGSICESVGRNFEQGGSGPWGYFGQDYAKAVEFYAHGCEFGNRPSCGSLGALLLDGKGATKDETMALKLLREACEFATVLEGARRCFQAGAAIAQGHGTERDDIAAHQLFERGCRLGEAGSCRMVHFYDGTGGFSERDPPSGAVGYAFGISAAQAAQTCRSSGFTFTVRSDVLASCSGSDSHHGFQVITDLCDGHVCGLGLNASVEGDVAAWVGRYRAIVTDLTKRYGEPSDVKWIVPERCQRESAFPSCIRGGDVVMATSWVWPSSQGVGASLKVQPDGRRAVWVFYATPESARQSKQTL
jgi:hypothetical protein